MRTIIYIDGFNFFYSTVHKTPYKWLDFRALFNRILTERNEIQEIKYFTAMVIGTNDDPDKPKRQEIYLRALREYIPELSIYFGHFLEHPKIMRRVHPRRREKYVEVFRREEKGSDVNLAVHLLNDAWLEKYDCAVIVSNDSDLEGAVKIVKQDLKKAIGWTIYDTADSRYYFPSKELRKYATFIKHITKSSLAASQLPETIPGTKIVKPSSW